MSVVRLGKREEAPVNGGAMDKVVARRGLAPRTKMAIGGALLLALAPAAYFAAPAHNSQTVTTERLTISTVNRGTFEDFLPLRGRVTPSLTVYLDAVEGGRVERILVEDGALVQEGQLLAVLSNSDLQLNVLARQTEVTQQINSMRSQELALSQTRLANERALIDAQLTAQTTRRQSEVQAPLAERGFVPGRVIADSRDTYQAAQRRADVLRRQQATDERLQSQQLAQLRYSASALNDSLGLARASLDALNLRAPVSGQITSFSIQVGQSLQRGELGVDQRALVGQAGLRQREFLAAHRVDLLGDLGLAREHVELEVGVREDCEKLALLDDGAVLDEDPLDPAALDRVEIDGQRRSDPAAQGEEVLEGAAIDRRNGQPLGGHRLAVAGGGSEIGGRSEREKNRAADRQLGAGRQAAARDDLVHRSAADWRLLAPAKTDDAHQAPQVFGNGQ